MYNNQFINLSPQLSLEDIARVESEIGSKLPEDLKQHYFKYNGGRPVKSICSTDDGSHVSVHGFMPMRHGEKGTLFETTWIWHKIETPFIPEHLIPFAYDEGGEYFCYSVAKEKPGAIYHFWSDFADDLDRAISYISPSLEEFINSLKERADV